MLLAVLETYFLKILMSAVSSTASIPVCYVVISPKNILIYESEMALLVRSGELSYEFFPKMQYLLCAIKHLDNLMAGLLRGLECSNKTWGENRKIWKE